MENKGYGNFSFIYQINPSIYAYLSTVERQARINVNASLCNSIRQAMEVYIHDVIRQNNLEAFVPIEKTLWEQICLLKSPRKLRESGYQGPNIKKLLACNRFDAKQGKPLDTVKYEVNGSDDTTHEKEDSYYKFICELGNAASHPEPRTGDAKLNYTNTITALKCFYQILRYHYRDAIPHQVSAKFEEDKMPIGEYIIDKAEIPSDKALSKCVREFRAHTVGVDGEPEFYALLRMYKRSEVDTEFMLRNYTCFKEASKVSFRNVPDGMAQLQALTPMHSDSEFYIISYIFNRQTDLLSNSLLQKINMKQRLELCRGLVQCLDNLHHSKTPIFHRMLNCGSIYLNQFDDIWIPYIVKFDFAKIQRDGVGTVKVQAADANLLIQATKNLIYLPPEWRCTSSDAPNLDWEKVDVFSLGAVMSMILSGNTTRAVLPTTGELMKAGVSASVIEMLVQMLDDDPDARLSLQNVREMLNREVG